MSNPQTLIQPDTLATSNALARGILDELNGILLGRPDLHEMVLVGIFARGHILLEGLPGVGKTALVTALGELLNVEFNRVQFTPDLMPGDILGSHLLQQSETGQRTMEFQPGPIFTNILLGDEINRASPKTQSALLEAMQEHSVTLMGTTRALPDPFFVLASQNPIELEGTYPLPEAQLDRFLFKLSVAAADVSTMEEIITTRRHGLPPQPTKTLSREDLNTVFDAVSQIFLPRPVARYIARVVAATHPGGDEATDAINAYVTYGASPRAAIAMAESARAMAMLHNEATVSFESVQAVAAGVLNHRLLLNYKARFDGRTSSDLIEELLASLDETGLNLPDDLTVEAVQ